MLNSLQYLVIGIICFLFELLSLSCSSIKKEKREVLLTCNFFLTKKNNHYELFFRYEKKEKVTISKDAEKLYWKDCEIAVQEHGGYLYISASKNDFEIKRFSDFTSINQFFFQMHDSTNLLRFHYSEAIYNSLAY